MAYVVMNAVDVPAERAAEFEERFAKRAGRVQDSPGFEAFDAWVSSQDFAAGHQQHAQQGAVSTRSETWMFELLEGVYS